MPQLDRLAYQSEVIWLIVCFLGLYFLLLKTGLKVIYKVLFFRKELFKRSRDNVLVIGKEDVFVKKSTNGDLWRIFLNNKELYNEMKKLFEDRLEWDRTSFIKNQDFLRRLVLSNYKQIGIVNVIELSNMLMKNNYLKDREIIEKKVS